jgi:transcriptional regulator with XRE-family HTH domain
MLMRFGKKVRLERERRNLSQEELGLKAKVHRTYIGMIERGEKNITLLNIQKLAVAFNLSLTAYGFLEVLLYCTHEHHLLERKRHSCQC